MNKIGTKVPQNCNFYHFLNDFFVFSDEIRRKDKITINYGIFLVYLER